MLEPKLFRNPLETCMACAHTGVVYGRRGSYSIDYVCCHRDSDRRDKIVRTFVDGATLWSEKCPLFEMRVSCELELKRARDPGQNGFIRAYLTARAALRAARLVAEHLADEPMLGRVLKGITEIADAARSQAIEKAVNGEVEALYAPEEMRETVRMWAAEQANPGRAHILSCNEYHVHTPPGCCSESCWCRAYGR